MTLYNRQALISLASKILVFVIILLATISCSRRSEGENYNQAVAESGTLKTNVALVNSPRKINAEFMCYNSNAILVESWENQAFLKSIKDLNPRVLRFPGGTVADFWDWQRGGLIQDRNHLTQAPPIFRNYRVSQYQNSKLENFQTALKSTDTVPLFVLNILTSNLENQLQMLREAKNLGIPIKYIEIGNESYFNLPKNREVFPTPNDYAQTAKQWVSAIKKEFPEVEIAVIGVHPNFFRNKNPRLENWNHSIFNVALPPADAISLHVYHPPEFISSITESKTYPFFTNSDVPVILGLPFANWEKMQQNNQIKDIPSNKEIWITEYNLLEMGGRFQPQRIIGSWAHGLQTMAMSLLFLEDERITKICNHVLVGNSMFGAMFADENAIGQKVFIHPSQHILVKPYSLSATGSVLRLLGDATKGMTTATKINFPNSLTLTGINNYKYPALYGWQFSNGEDSKAIVINLSDRDLNIDLSSLFKQKVNYEQISGQPRTLVKDPSTLTYKSGSVSGSIKLPAYSVTKIAK